MKTWLKVLIIIAVIGVIGAIGVYKYISQPNKDIEKAKAEFTLKVDDLYNEYNNNKAKADSLYNGKVIEVSGNLTAIETPSDTMVVAVFTQKQNNAVSESEDLLGDLNAEGGVRCTMLSTHCEATKKKTPNSHVRIKGLCKGMAGTDLIFEKCSIVK